LFNTSSFLQHPLFLLVFVAIGGLIGYTWPAASPALEGLGYVYLFLLEMCAIPLMMVAVILGLKQMISLPNASVRLSGILLTGLAAILVAGLLGSFGAAALMGKEVLSDSQRAVLGEFTSLAVPALEITLRGEPETDSSHNVHQELVPSNILMALVQGSVPAILLGSLLFGIALARQVGPDSKSFFGTLEMIYRSLEVLIDRINYLLPLAALSFAGALTGANDGKLISSVGGFLWPFLSLSFILTVSMLVLISHLSGRSLSAVLQMMVKPITISMISPLPTAAVPNYIEIMSNQLGFTRAISELVAPISPYFFRTGEALFFGMLGVYLSRVYNHALPPMELIQIGLLATTAAFVSVGSFGIAPVLLSSVMLVVLDLPLEGILPALLAIEIICSGARNVVSSLCACGLIALASKGLVQRSDIDLSELKSTLIMAVFDRKLMWAILALTLLALTLTFLTGVGVGMRR
jgi:Na+/H+-dicarboxylate symporter